MKSYYRLYLFLGSLVISILVFVSYQYIFVATTPETNSNINNFSEEAESLSQKVNAQRQDYGDTENIGTENPKEVVALMIEYLGRAEPEVRLEAVQTLCDLRFVPYAQPAIPALEKVLDDPEPDIRDFAKLAIQRIRFSGKRK